MKLTSLAFGLALALSGASNAAIYAASNVALGAAGANADTAITNSANVRLNNAVVTVGYFAAGFDVAANVGNTALLIANYTVVATALTGTASATLEGSFAGFAEGPNVDTANITTGDALLGRTLYSFVGNNTTLGTSNAFGLVSIGPILDDVPNERTYIANATNKTVLIGTKSTVVVADAGIAGTYNSLRLVAVPEPSAALLGMLGALGLLRRRR